MNKYELAVVVSAKIEDDERAQVIEKVKAAYYYFIHFESDAETPSEIEQRIRIMDNVIRFLCVRQDA